MVYVLINNNYHLDDFEKFRSQLNYGDVTLITVPHTLNSVDKRYGLFADVFTFESPFKGIKSSFKYTHIVNTLREVKRKIKPVEKDQLIFFTDFEILNQYIVSIFKAANARVIMLEDAMATVTVGNMDFTKLPFKDSIQKWMLKNVYGLSFLNFIAEKNSSSLPVMEDKYIDAIGLSILSPLKRKIPVHQLSVTENKINDLKKGSVLFINQDIYNFDNISFESYLEFVKKILTVLAENFEEVYFKFHPRETEEVRNRIKSLTDALDSVVLITEFKVPVERQVEQLRPGYSVSFYSNSLKSLYFKGIEPFFIYHLIPGLKDSAVGHMMTNYLQHVNYQFIEKIEEMAPGYKSGIEIANSSVALEHLLNNRKES